MIVSNADYIRYLFTYWSAIIWRPVRLRWITSNLLIGRIASEGDNFMDSCTVHSVELVENEIETIIATIKPHLVRSLRPENPTHE